MSNACHLVAGNAIRLFVIPRVRLKTTIEWNLSVPTSERVG